MSAQTSTEKLALEKYLPKHFVGSSHYWAMQAIAEVTPETPVLDVGSGSGVMAEYLGKLGFDELYSVELEDTTRRETEYLYKESAASIEAFRNRDFGLIFLLDIIEHIPNPEPFYHRVMELLRPGGIALVSVPNVAHWSVRLPLMFAGSFTYHDRAILDKTHVQFFDRKRFKDFIQMPENIEIDSLSASIPPSEFVLPQIIWDNAAYRFGNYLHWQLAQILPGFWAYQHCAVVRKVV